MSISVHFQEPLQTTRQKEYSLQEILTLPKPDPLNLREPEAERLLCRHRFCDLSCRISGPAASQLPNKYDKRLPRLWPSDSMGMEDDPTFVLSPSSPGVGRTQNRSFYLGSARWAVVIPSLAEKLKALMQQVPFYAIKDSPVFESPSACSARGRTAPSLKRLRHPAPVYQQHSFCRPLGASQTPGTSFTVNQPVSAVR